jgi:methylglutaconyl-CoA hydratase
MFDTIMLKIDPRGVARVTLNRSDKHNAMNAQMIADLTQVAALLGRDASVRVVVLTGAGDSFCAGGDLDWMRAQMQADGVTRAREAGALATMLGALDALPKPLIGRIQGQAYGGGIGLMAVCDVAIGVSGARFGLTETRLGLIPATIGPYVVARMGAAKARRVFMSARLFDTQEAVALDLLARAVAPDALDNAVEAEVRAYLSCAPGAVAAAKALARQLGGAPGPEQIAMSISALVERWESPEAAEGIAAFFDRRKPVWAEPG